jgi:NAD(P)-dependent dehydrogenase (short-subunit alcohol dehydrogenase family)
MGRFDGRTVMVTGAGTGFGAELAVKAAEEGAARVVVHYRSSKAGAETTAQRVADAGAEALLVQGDISLWDDIKRMVAEAGEVDVLVNNVGDMASEQNSWDELTEATIDHVLGVDIKGTMLMVHEFGSAMKARGRVDRGARAAADDHRRADVDDRAAAARARRSTRPASTGCWASPSPTPRRWRRRCASTRSRPASWRPRRS